MTRGYLGRFGRVSAAGLLLASAIVGSVAGPAAAAQPAAADMQGSTLWSTGALPTVVPTTHITGKVTDLDGNPLADVRAEADVSGSATATAWTGSDGTYSIAVAAGTYAVCFTDDPYSFFGKNHSDGCYGTSGYVPYRSQAASVVVGSDDVGGIDISLLPPLFIKGTVTSVSGPIPYITATITGPGGFLPTTTSAQGSYSVQVLPGSYMVQFTDGTGVYANGYYGSGGYVAGVDAAVPVVVSTTTVTGIDAQLPTIPIVHGVVTGPGGSPLIGITVTAPAPGGTGNYTTTTGTGGAYVLRVPAGSYAIRCFDSLGVYASGYYTSAEPTGYTADAASASQVVVGTTDVFGIDVELPTAPTLSGRITGPGDAPLVGITVQIPRGAGYVQKQTGTDGTYSFSVTPGDYTVIVFDGNGGLYNAGYYSAAGPGGYAQHEAAATTIHVGSTSATDINVQMPLAPTISGTVTGSGGIPLSHIWVGGGGHTYTGTDGTYTLRVQAGSHQVEFIDESTEHTSGWYGSSGFVADQDGAVNLLVGLDGVTGIDVEMPLAPPVISGPPTAVAATPYDSSALVSWTAPTSTGHTAITGYTVTAWAGDWPRPIPTDATCSTSGALTCTVYGLVNHTSYTFTVTAANSQGESAISDPSLPVIPRQGATYFPLRPNRLADSTTGSGLATKLSANTPATFQVADRLSGQPDGNVPATATAVTGFLTVLHPSAAGSLSLTPTPDSAPTTSTLNFPKGDARSTGVTVPLGPGGTLSVTYGAVSGSQADVYFDVTGYFASGTRGATYVAVTPTRLVDSRSRLRIHKLVSGIAQTVQIPFNPSKSSFAVGMTGTLTVTNQSAAGYLTIEPVADDSPATATMYFPRGDNRATGVTLALGAGIYFAVVFKGPPGATADVIFDVTGYFWPDRTGATYVPVAPNRLVDSRIKQGLSQSLSPYVAKSFQATGRYPGDQTRNVPANATAVTGTLTVTGQTAAGWLALTQAANNHPATSTLNFPTRDNRATGVTVPIGTGGKIWITFGTNARATTNVVFDVTGYFLP